MVSLLGTFRHQLGPARARTGTETRRIVHTWSIFQLLKRRYTFEELVAQDTQGPKIDGFIMLFAVDHFRGQIVQRSTQGLASISRGVDAPAEIADLEIAFDAQQQVLGLDIAVNNMLAVQV